MDFEYKMVIVARQDLKLSPGKLAAQVAHAAVACAFSTKKYNAKWLKKWQDGGGKKAVVLVERESDFYPLIEKAKSLDVVYDLVSDAGHTEIPFGTKTVVGFGPGPSNIIDQITGDLSLM